jgi:hypothetical protein
MFKVRQPALPLIVGATPQAIGWCGLKVVNAIVAVPVMALLMRMATNVKILGALAFVNSFLVRVDMRFIPRKERQITRAQ